MSYSEKALAKRRENMLRRMATSRHTIVVITPDNRIVAAYCDDVYAYGKMYVGQRSIVLHPKVTGEYSVIINAHGKQDGEQRNAIASLMLGDEVFGNAVICNGFADTLSGLTDTQKTAIIKKARSYKYNITRNERNEVAL